MKCKKKDHPFYDSRGIDGSAIPLPRSAIVEGFLPVGTYILAGAPKCGKSFWVTQLCLCVAEGVPFLGFSTQRAEALYLALEDTPERLQDRLNRMFGVEWCGELFHLKFQTELQGQLLADLLGDFVFEHPRYPLDRNRHLTARTSR